MVDLVSIANKWTKGFDKKNLRRFEDDNEICSLILRLDKKITTEDDASQSIIALIERFDYLNSFKETDPKRFPKTMHYMWGEGWGDKSCNSGRFVSDDFIRIEKSGYDAASFDDIYLFYFKHKGNHSDRRIFLLALERKLKAEELGINEFMGLLKQAIVDDGLIGLIQSIDKNHTDLKGTPPSVELFEYADGLNIPRRISRNLILGGEFSGASARLDAYQCFIDRGFEYEEFKVALFKDGLSYLQLAVKQLYKEGMNKQFFFNPDLSVGDYWHWINRYADFAKETDIDYANLIWGNCNYTLSPHNGRTKHEYSELVKIGKLPVKKRRRFTDFIEQESELRKADNHQLHDKAIITDLHYQQGLYPAILGLINEGDNLTVDHIRKLYELTYTIKSRRRPEILTKGSIQSFKAYLGI